MSLSSIVVFKKTFGDGKVAEVTSEVNPIQDGIIHIELSQDGRFIDLDQELWEAVSESINERMRSLEDAK